MHLNNNISMIVIELKYTMLTGRDHADMNHKVQ
jgi:hypothetical protein